MKTCHIVAPSYSELASIFLVRNIYKPDMENLSAEKEQALNRRFSEGYQKLKDHPEIVAMLAKIKEYYNDLKVLNIKDSEVCLFHGLSIYFLFFLKVSTYSSTIFYDIFEILQCFIMIIVSGSIVIFF